MPGLMRIDIVVGRVGQSVRELRQVADATGEVAKQQERLARSQAKVNRSQSRGAGAGAVLPGSGPGAVLPKPLAPQGAAVGSGPGRLLPAVPHLPAPDKGAGSALPATPPVAEAAGAAGAPVSWSQFTKGKMGAYMQSEGSHAAAMARLSREWAEYKAGQGSKTVGDLVANTPHPGKSAAATTPGGNGTGSNLPASPGAARVPSVSGPFQRRAKAQQALAAAQAKGDLNAIRDAELAVARYGDVIGKLGQPKKTPGDAIWSGAEQKLTKAQGNLQKALATGTQEQIDDARAAVVKAERAVANQRKSTQPQAPKTLGQRALEAVFSSRFRLPGTLGAIQPLIGRSLDVLFPGIHKAVFGGGGFKNMQSMPGGIGGLGQKAIGQAGQGIMGQVGKTAMGQVGRVGSTLAGQVGRVGGVLARLGPAVGGAIAALGPVGVVAIGVAAALTTVAVVTGAVVKAMGELSRKALEFGNARLMSGDTKGTSTFFATAMGMEPGQLAGRAASLRQNLAGNGLAAGAAAQIGVGHVLPRGLGPSNDAEVLQKVMVGLRGVTDTQERYNLAVRMGAEDLLPLIAVSDEVWARQMRLAELQKDTYDPKTERSARDFSANMRTLGANIGLIGARWKKAALGPVTEGVGKLADMFGTLADAAKVFEPVGKAIGTGVGNILKTVAFVGTALVDAWSILGDVVKDAGKWVVSTAKKIPWLWEVLGKLGDWVGKVTTGIGLAVKGAGTILHGAGEISRGHLQDGEKTIKDGLGEITKATGVLSGKVDWRDLKDKENRSRDRNTDAINNLNSTIEEGMFGGGERARSAVPAGWKGYYMARQGEADALRAGAFSL